MKYNLLCLFVYMLLAQSGLGQEPVVNPDSLAVDATTTKTIAEEASEPKKEEKTKKSKRRTPSPKKALILSLTIPGGGQIYNRKYWKAPIAMGGVGLMVYFISFNTERYRYYKQQYIYRVDGDPDTKDVFEQFGWGADDIKQRRDYFNKNKELSYIGIILVQILGGVDAFVDAHLMNFDVSDDLTMRISPKADFGPFEGGNIGLGMSLHLKQKEQIQPKDFFGIGSY